MVDGKFIGADGTVPTGQEIVDTLLDRCFLWSEIVLERYCNSSSFVNERHELTTIPPDKAK